MGLLIASALQLWGAAVGVAWGQTAAVVLLIAAQVLWDLSPAWVVAVGVAGSVIGTVVAK